MGRKNKKKTPCQAAPTEEPSQDAVGNFSSKRKEETVKPKMTPQSPGCRTVETGLNCGESDQRKGNVRKNILQVPRSKLAPNATYSDEDKEVLTKISPDIKNPDVPITLKNLVSAITKAASDRKKAAGSTKKDHELKEELGSLLRQIKMDDMTRASPLASDRPLTNEEGLTELMHLLSAKSDGRSAFEDSTSPSITEYLLDSTSRVGQLGSDGSSESEAGKNESGMCQFCELEAATKCTGCRKVFYCSRDCQKSHWTAHKDVCRPYKVAKVEGFGRVLVATRIISPEEEVMREKPFVVGPRPSADPVCLGCYRRVSGGYKCRVCSWPVCSEACANSSQHAVECEASAKAGLAGPDSVSVGGYAGQQYEVVTTLRCLVAMSKDVSRWRAMLERFGARHSLVLPTSLQHMHYQQAIVEPLRSSFRIHQHPDLATVEDSTVHTVLNVLQVHSVPSRSTYGEVSGLYPMASLLGHSCVPNTRTRLQGEHLIVTATDTIVAGTPITAMFTDILWGTKARRDHLLQTRFFSCSCRRCSDPTELGSYFSALICPKCHQTSHSSQSPTNVPSPVLPTKPLVSSAPWTCNTCKYQISADELLETNLTLGSEASTQLTNPTIEGLEGLLQKWLSKVHTNHYHLHAIKHSLLQLYGRAKEDDEKKDETYWKEIAKKERICQEFLKVCSLLDPSMAHSVPQFGLAFYELHKTVLQYAKRNFSLAKLGTQQLKKKMQLAKALLRRSMDILKHEAEDTPEGQLYCRCQEEFISIGKWMLAVGLV